MVVESEVLNAQNCALSKFSLPIHSNVQNRPRLKGPPFFSALYNFFFENFLMLQRVPPLSFLLYCNRMHVYTSKRDPLLLFSALCNIFRKKKIYGKIKFFFKKNVLRFLSLRYSADFRRSRLVSRRLFP